MPTQPIIDVLDKLIKLHKNLNQLAAEKMEAVKEPDLKRLGILLTSEKAHLKAIEQLEEERRDHVRSFLKQNGVAMDHEPTFEDCLAYANETEKEILMDRRTNLKMEIEQLKQANSLNQQLIYQSLQFVNMNLSLLLPEEDTYTYERSGDSDLRNEGKLSIFDSKA